MRVHPRRVASVPSGRGAGGSATTARPAGTPREGAAERGLLLRAVALRILLPLTIPALILITWQGVTTSQLLPHGLLPTPFATLQGFRTWVLGGAAHGGPYSGTWLATVAVSTERVVLGFCAAAVVGILLGLAIGRVSWAAAAVMPTFNGIRSIPAPAWLPIMLIFFGVSLAGQVVLIALVAFSPVVINTALGASSVDPLLLRAARMLGASRFQTLLRVVVPASLPSIFAGLRLALAFSWVALVIAELAGATSGIGYTLYQAYYFDRPDIMLADMITVGALGVLSDRVLRLVAKQITHT